MTESEFRKICRTQKTSKPSSAFCLMIMKGCYLCIVQLARELPMLKENNLKPSQITPHVCQIHSSQGNLLINNSSGDRAALKNLQASESAHVNKQALSAELQRNSDNSARVRVAELKRKEKDMDRIIEKWQKPADSQGKLSVLPSGMRCINVCCCRRVGELEQETSRILGDHSGRGR